MTEALCVITECGRGIYVRVDGYHCRLCFSAITNGSESNYEESETDEGFEEDNAYNYSPEVEPHIVSLLVTIICFLICITKCLVQLTN